MSTASLETIIAKLRELADDRRNQVDLPAPVSPGSMTWLKERFETKLERPLPADLGTLLEAFDGCHIADATIFGSRGAHGLVDHNLELRRPGGKWVPQWIVIGTLGTMQSLVHDVDTGTGHVSDLLQPRWVKTLPSFPALLVHVIRDQLGVRARPL